MKFAPQIAWFSKNNQLILSNQRNFDKHLFSVTSGTSVEMIETVNFQKFGGF